MVLAARIAATILAVVFAWAALAKLRDRTATGEGFAAMGLPRPTVLAVAVPVGELAITVALLSVPVWGAQLAAAALAAFTVQLASLLRSGRPVACNCFGGSPTEPVSRWTLARNAALFGLAVFIVAVG